MRHHTLDLITNSDDYLAQLLNQYMNKLSTMDICSYPMDSLKETLFPGKEDPQRKYRIETLYELTALCNSLHTLHRYIGLALEKINEYEKDYEYNWKHFATVDRMRCIQEYGSDDDSDFNDDNTVKFKEDKKSLRSYTMKDALNGLFETGHNDFRGERIGTSCAFDFMRFTDVVRRNTQFCIFKAFQHINGSELNIYQKDSTGQMKPMSLGDKVESELNEDIKNALIADVFEAVLQDAEEAAKLYNSIKPFQDEKEKYQELQFRLKRMLSLTYELTE